MADEPDERRRDARSPAYGAEYEDEYGSDAGAGGRREYETQQDRGYLEPDDDDDPPRRRSAAGLAAQRMIGVLVILGLLGGGAYAAWYYLIRDKPTKPSATSSTACPTPKAKKSATSKASAKPASTKKPATRTKAAQPSTRFPLVVPAAPAKVSVIVLNSTQQRGLAGRVTHELESRGFLTAAAANADRPFHGTVQIRYGKSSAASAVTLAAQVRGAAPVLDNRTSTRVDFIIGDAYRHLRTPAQASAAIKAATAAARNHC